MKTSLLALLFAAGLAVAAEPAKEATPAPATPEPKPFFDPAAPAPTVDPTKPTPEPSIPAPEKKKPVVPERKKKKEKK
jgi:outer membrane biosynthesis protein TonB